VPSSSRCSRPSTSALGEIYAQKRKAGCSASAPKKKQAAKARQHHTQGQHHGKVTGFMEYERIEEGYKPVPSV
jgi:hypothetical protein